LGKRRPWIFSLLFKEVQIFPVFKRLKGSRVGFKGVIILGVPNNFSLGNCWGSPKEKGV